MDFETTVEAVINKFPNFQISRFDLANKDKTLETAKCTLLAKSHIPRCHYATAEIRTRNYAKIHSPVFSINKLHYTILRSLKVIDFGTNGKPMYDLISNFFCVRVINIWNNSHAGQYVPRMHITRSPTRPPYSTKL